jgi:trans-2-enoyl-CoA reductase
MGFDAWFFARIDVGEENKRVEKKEMEWIQKPNNQSFGETGDYHLFTHKMRYLYFSPEGFDYDVFVDSKVFETNENLPTFDADERAKAFDEYL